MPSLQKTGMGRNMDVNRNMSRRRLRENDNYICRKCKTRYYGNSHEIRQLVNARYCVENAFKIIDKYVEKMVKERSQNV